MSNPDGCYGCRKVEARKAVKAEIRCPECRHAWRWHAVAGCSADVVPSCVCPVRIVVAVPEAGEACPECGAAHAEYAPLTCVRCGRTEDEGSRGRQAWLGSLAAPEAGERRAPVQRDGDQPPGTITWAEHVEAATAYNREGHGQSAERLAERGGFGYRELQRYLGHDPTTWEPR